LKRTSSARCLFWLFSRKAPVPIMPLDTQVSGFAAIAAGWMIAW
jgi:hypothetical protein